MFSWASKVGVWAAGLLLLASCGGGDLVEPFEPTRIVAFGDEHSALDAQGRNYGVNGTSDADENPATPRVFDCTLQPNWAQYVASVFAVPFPQCPSKATTPPPSPSLLYATPGAKVAGAVAQLQAHLADDTLGPDELVTLMVGMHDILEQYARYPATDEATLVAELRARGAQLAGLVNRVADLDGRIIVATVPDLGLTPFGIAQEQANAGRAALLSRLTGAFNGRLRANITNDGRRIGLALADEMVQAIARSPANFGFRNAVAAACLTDAPFACTNETLVGSNTTTTDDDASAIGWLWATPTMLSAGGHARLGRIAAQRAGNNPF